MKINKFKVKFVNMIPPKLNDGVLYVCINCKIIIHKCACGCGEKTVTPIDNKNGWIMKYDGQAITLTPSIGNFSIPCKSHYYIRENRVEWVENQCVSMKDKRKNVLKKIKKYLFNIIKKIKY